MKREHKVWGERWLIRQDSTHAVSYLKIKTGFRCSWHKHNTKYNLFVVLKGKIGVVTEEIDGIKRESILYQGHCFSVRPEEWHEFRAYEDSEVIEEMYVSYCEQDIIRQSQGGVF